VVDLLTAVHDERALAVLLELDAEGPIAVRTLLGSYDFCESDLHGLLAELQAAGLITESQVAGERGYEVTEKGSVALGVVRRRNRD
jgi:predicted transcriptional regulator